MNLSTSVIASMLGASLFANCGTIASISGPDDGGELISDSRFVGFRWISSDAHFDVTVSARLAAVSAPFQGTAFITFGPCCVIGSPSGEIAHSQFTVSSQTPSDITLFRDLTLPPHNYSLILAGNGPVPGLWVTASPAFLTGSPDTGIGGGDAVAEGANANLSYPPSSHFVDDFKQTKFAVTEIPELPSRFLTSIGLITLLYFQARIGRKRRGKRVALRLATGSRWAGSV